MRKTGSRRWQARLVIAVFLVTTANTPTAGAEPAVVDQLRGSARSQALDLHLLGRRLGFGLAASSGVADRIVRRLDLSASGTGTLLSPRTTARAGRASTPEDGGRTCFQPPLGEVLGDAGLPQLILGEVACGEASAQGDAERFEALGTGHVSDLRLKDSPSLQSAIRLVATTAGAVGDTPLGDVLRATDTQSKEAVAALDGLFDRLVGFKVQELPGIDESQTMNELVARVAEADLFHVTLGDATATTTAVPDRLSVSADTQGGIIEVLPGFRGPHAPPLLTIVTGASQAAVTYDRPGTPTGKLRNALVSVESEFLARSGSIPIVEVAPGQSIDVLCDTPVAALCSTISVGQPRETKTPAGGLRVESAAVSVHLFKNLDKLSPASQLATVLSEGAILDELNAAAAREGLTLGEPSAVPGVRLDLALAVAEAGGEDSRVEPELPTDQRRGLSTAELPRTGTRSAGTVRFATMLIATGLTVLAGARIRLGEKRRRTG
jgi:hypothetical protein